MSYETIARRYARAVFEIGKEQKSLAQITRDLSDFSSAYETNDELRMVLGNPLVKEEQSVAVIRELAQRMGMAETSLSTLLLLAQRRRLPALPAIVRELQRVADEDTGVVRALVTSAGSLSEAYLNKLQGELERSTGKKVVITHQQDPSLIAGIVTRIGDRVIDGSVKTRLDSFRESLLGT
jgi:F-type H+-transporting ATPase subunit delta